MLILRRTPEHTLRSLRALTTQSRNYSKDYASSSDDEKDPKEKTKKAKHENTQARTAAPPTAGAVESESAASRLNRLLATMQTDDNLTLAKQAAATASTGSSTMARPGDAQRQRKDNAKHEAASKDVFAAAKRVAAMLGESDKKQTESELLSKLLGHNLQQDDATKKSTGGSGIAEAVPKKGGQSENELSLSDLIVGMKIDRSKKPAEEQTRGDFVRRTLSARSSSHANQQHQRSSMEPGRGDGGSYGQRKAFAQRSEYKREAETFTGSVNLFGGEPLGIFKNVDALRDSCDMLSTWAKLHERELRLQVTHPPANYFEKMTLWTEQGKVWRFPIDNEQDMPADEVDVDFSEHIFLEQHLEPWCPTRGPIRHFMELVCVGLSKNPYISAREKREHIHWYRDYFETKRDILKELMSKDKIIEASEKKDQALEG